MSTNTAVFFAPERPLQDHARKQRYAWRTALVSLLIHAGAIITVVVVSQYGIEKKKAAIASLSPPPTIQAVLFQPPANKTVEPSNLLNQEAVDKEMVDREVVDKETAEAVNEDASEDESADSEIQTFSTADIPDKPNAEPMQLSETKPLPDDHPPQLKDALSKEAPSEVSKPLINREAGRLNVSSAQAAADYLDSYNEARIGEESANAASSYAAKKRSPNIIDPRKGEDRDEKLYNQRPVKVVNCTGTTNKILTTLSGWAGGTMKCSKRNEYQRFIDARINKTSESDEQSN